VSGCPDDSSRSAAGGQPDVEEPELLIDGQEEVFSRTEVELGRVEHGVGGTKKPVEPRTA
jgi:hypothetical protein